MEVLERKLLKTVELAKVIGCSRSWIIKCRTNNPELKKYSIKNEKTNGHIRWKVEDLDSIIKIIAGE
mgnify:CR=1 FL=1